MSRTTTGPSVRFSPLSRRLHLGDELRLLRQEQDKSIHDAAKDAGVDRTLLTRIETGQRRVKPDQIMKVVESLGITQHTEQWQVFYALARDSDTSGWWESRAFRDMGPRQALAADLEAGASRIRWYDFALVPGLIQSPGYLRARHDPAVDYYLPADLPVAIRGRERRQQGVFTSGGPKIEVVVEEMVIRRLMVPKPVMLEQLRHLMELIDSSPQFDLRVLPVGGELLGIRAPRSPWQLYDFATEDPTVALVEALTEDFLLRDHGAVNYHEQLWKRLREMALPEVQTRALLEEAADSLSRELEKN